MTSKTIFLVLHSTHVKRKSYPIFKYGFLHEISSFFLLLLLLLNIPHNIYLLNMSKDQYLFDITKWLRIGLPNWTSGNEFIDRFIQETQSNAQHNSEVLEWIPYNKLEII